MKLSPRHGVQECHSSRVMRIKCEESTAEPHELSWAPTELERGLETA